MKFLRNAAFGCGTAILFVGTSHATTVQFVNVTGQSQASLFANFLPNAPKTTENFAGAATPGGNSIDVVTDAQDRTAGNQIETRVGTFAGLGGTGTGSSVTGNSDQIQIRSGNNFGRFSVLNDGGNFLDSNDTNGFSWTFKNTDNRIRGVSAFITDPNDTGGFLSLSLNTGETLWDFAIEEQDSSAQVWFLTADLSGLEWQSATLDFKILAANGNEVNDGFAISDPTLHAVPLPAPALLLLSAMGTLGGISALRRRKSA